MAISKCNGLVTTLKPFVVTTLVSQDKVPVANDCDVANLQLLYTAWYSQLPSWVSNGGFDNATLISILQNHIAVEAGR